MIEAMNELATIIADSRDLIDYKPERGLERIVIAGRAEGCSDEYANVAYAFKTLIGPYIDRKLAAKMHKNWLPPVNTRPPLRPAGLVTRAPEQ
jgi:hypothetical protein